LDCGLEAALRAQCRRFESATLSLDLRVVESLDGLPAAVEVAAYRIVSEALANVAKHAQARTCRITVGRQRALSIEIVDDGVGIESASAGRRGVGLDSMRERASELGGECLVSEGTSRGTAVRVRLPIGAIRVS
jgi:two-component system, NarL family, sensor kinase